MGMVHNITNMYIHKCNMEHSMPLKKREPTILLGLNPVIAQRGSNGLEDDLM